MIRRYPLIEPTLDGLLVRYRPDYRHVDILSRVEVKDLRHVDNVGWVITNPLKYEDVPEIAEAVQDYKRQMVLPFGGEHG